MVKFPDPLKGTVFYEDEKAYACLAFHPIVEGHTIVAWKEDIEDLNDLTPRDYEHLMRVVLLVRGALMRYYNAPKVYTKYLDEFRHVHWHLAPRKEGDEMGFGLMNKPHGELADTDFAPTVEKLHLLMRQSSIDAKTSELKSEIQAILDDLKKVPHYKEIPEDVWVKITQKSFKLVDIYDYYPGMYTSPLSPASWGIKHKINEVIQGEVVDSGRAFARVELRGIMEDSGCSGGTVLINMTKARPRKGEVMRAAREVLTDRCYIAGPVVSDVWVNGEKYTGPNFE